MPRKIVEEETEDDEEDFIEDELEEDELESETKGRGRLKKHPIKTKKDREQEEVKRRYNAFNIPQRYGIIDAETGEPLAEGEYAIFQALADVIERLERIENSIGSMLEG